VSDLYRELILDHYQHPRGSGRIEGAASAEGYNPLCGDEVELFLRVEGDQVVEAGFVGRGCAISQAAASLLIEAINGRALAEARDFKSAELLEMLGIPLTPVRLKCALLPLETLHLAAQAALTAQDQESGAQDATDD
jgi:nitrogen fixation NifU-like protein